MAPSDTFCTRLHVLVRGLPRFRFTDVDTNIPPNGVYYVFEAGESAHGGDRIVRIGSHTGRGNLASRLAEHVTVNKDRSIFRKNIGRALLNRRRDPFLQFWEFDLTKRADRAKYEHLVDMQKQQAIEREVSEYVEKRLSYAVIGTEHGALHLERKSIGTVSKCSLCSASIDWLGRDSPKVQIREFGLWQVQHLGSEPLTQIDLSALDEGNWPAHAGH